MASPEHGPRHEPSAEHLPKDLERAPEIHDAKQERTPEESRESAERKIERAREEASKEAVSGREVSRGEHRTEDESPIATPASREESYKRTLKHVQAEMSGPARAFSKIIHNPTVEKVSDTLGSTVARPDAILSGSFFACILVLGLYLLARQNGFSLSGFETIGAFVVGWVLGIIFDFLRTMITGKR